MSATSASLPGAPSRWGRPAVARWQVVVGGLAVLAAIAAVWLTLDAEFLRYPGWLAAQKADLILGPVFVGLYWVRRRPHSRFGPMLIALGFVGAVYVLQSSTNPWLFGIGVVWENVIYVATLVLILAFPTGHLDGVAAKLIVVVGILAAAVPASIIVFVLPQVGAGASISGCRALCPDNAIAVTSDVDLALALTDVYRPGAIVVAFATAALLIWRFLGGTAPQRRALAIGTPIAGVPRPAGGLPAPHLPAHGAHRPAGRGSLDLRRGARVDLVRLLRRADRRAGVRGGRDAAPRAPVAGAPAGE